MGRKIKIYQTLEDRQNPEQIERDGPFICRWKNSWLGTGYYFWETFSSNAHWWGKAHLKGSYVICEAEYEFDDEKIFDLSGGNTQHNLEFDSYINFLKTKGYINEKTTVSRVFHFLRTYIKSFNFEASRAYGINSIGGELYPDHVSKMKFEKHLHAYMELTPAVQICFYTKTALNLKKYHIVYPDEYIDQYVL